MTKLTHEFDDALERDGFTIGGLSTKIRYCSVCQKRLVPPRQLLKSAGPGVLKTCFCRRCAIEQLPKDQEK